MKGIVTLSSGIVVAIVWIAAMSFFVAEYGASSPDCGDLENTVVCDELIADDVLAPSYVPAIGYGGFVLAVTIIVGGIIQLAIEDDHKKKARFGG